MENNLLIRIIPGKNLYQNSVTKIGLEITNIGKEPLKGCTVQNIRISSVEGKNICLGSYENFHISLNPNETKRIWTKGANTINLYGLVCVSALLNSDVSADTVKTFQEDTNSKDINECGNINSWQDMFYIESVFERNQKNTNKILIFFTAITTACTIFMMILTYLIFTGK